MARRRWTRWIICSLVALYVIALVPWIARTGLRLRSDAWQTTKADRFHSDIAGGFHWGRQVNLAARAPGSKTEPTLWELIRGEDQVYRNLVDHADPADYQLDYPPLRLLTMALWYRAVSRDYPDLQGWPGPTRQIAIDRAGHVATESIAQPLLAMNTWAVALAAVFAAALTTLWLWRSADHKRFPRIDGVLLFMIVFPALAYAMAVAVNYIASPPPTVSIAQSPVMKSADTAVIRAFVNPHGESAHVSVQWGTSEGDYPHKTPARNVEGVDDQPVAIDVPSLPAHQWIHYRIVARNDSRITHSRLGRGTTQTADAMFFTDQVVQPAQPTDAFGETWLSRTTWMAVGIVFVAMCWAIHRMDRRHRGWACALIVATWIWFDPALLMDAHVWPQWDVWLLPPFLGAALAASLDLWFTAGLMLGFGLMFKGQLMIGMPVLIIWPIAARRWGAALRLIVGGFLSAGLILSPFITLGGKPPADAKGAIVWIICVLIATGVGVAISFVRWPIKKTFREIRERRRTKVNDSQSNLWKSLAILGGGLLCIAIAAVLVLHPWPPDADLGRRWGIYLLAAILIVPWLIRRRALSFWIAMVLATSIWLSPWLFEGDWSWKTVGFEYGTHKFDRPAMSDGSNGNLPSILSVRFGWELHDPVFSIHLPNLAAMLHLGKDVSTIPAWMQTWGLDGKPTVFDLKQTMVTIFAILTLACGCAAAMHARRRDPRVLVSLVAPWVLMHSVLCQMANRYEIWGAAMSIMLVAVAPELMLITLVLSLTTALMIWCQLLHNDNWRSPLLQRMMQTLSPDIGWLMLATAAVVFFIAVTPGGWIGRRRVASIRHSLDIPVDSFVRRIAASWRARARRHAADDGPDPTADRPRLLDRDAPADRQTGADLTLATEAQSDVADRNEFDGQQS